MVATWSLHKYFQETFDEWAGRYHREMAFLAELDRERVAAGLPTIAEALKAEALENEARKARTDTCWEASPRARLNIPYDYVLHPPERVDPVVAAVLDSFASIPWSIDPETMKREQERVSSPPHVEAEERFEALNKQERRAFFPTSEAPTLKLSSCKRQGQGTCSCLCHIMPAAFPRCSSC